MNQSLGMSRRQPELRPLLNPEFVDSTESLRSFVVSLLIAAYLGYRWFRDHRMRKEEHTLDGYIRALMEIEIRQIDIDGSADAKQVRSRWKPSKKCWTK
jgi:hypothetical protein